jgi:hypothetical protein
MRALRRRNEIEKERRLAQRQRAVDVGAHDEELLVQRVAAAVLDRRREHIEPIRRLCVQIPQDSAPPEVVIHAIGDVAPHDLEEGMARRDPLERRVVAQ